MSLFLFDIINIKNILFWYIYYSVYDPVYCLSFEIRILLKHHVILTTGLVFPWVHVLQYVPRPVLMSTPHEEWGLDWRALAPKGLSQSHLHFKIIPQVRPPAFPSRKKSIREGDFQNCCSLGLEFARDSRERNCPKWVSPIYSLNSLCTQDFGRALMAIFRISRPERCTTTGRAQARFVPKRWEKHGQNSHSSFPILSSHNSTWPPPVPSPKPPPPHT